MYNLHIIAGDEVHARPVAGCFDVAGGREAKVVDRSAEELRPVFGRHWGAERYYDSKTPGFFGVGVGTVSDELNPAFSERSENLAYDCLGDRVEV